MAIDVTEHSGVDGDDKDEKGQDNPAQQKPESDDDSSANETAAPILTSEDDELIDEDAPE